MNITFDSSHATIKGSTKAQINASITIAGSGTKLPITIVGEFKDIPPHLHQIYIQAMWSSYGDTNVHNNTEPEPKTIEEQKSEWRLNRIVDIIAKAIRK
jgi:hypothetical protein